MCSFNAINGVPGVRNPYTETDILKKEWGFDGFIESDYTAVAETQEVPAEEARREVPVGTGLRSTVPTPARRH